MLSKLLAYFTPERFVRFDDVNGRRSIVTTKGVYAMHDRRWYRVEAEDVDAVDITTHCWLDDLVRWGDARKALL